LSPEAARASARRSLGAFVEAGAKVMICSRHEDELKSAVVEITEGIPGAEVRAIVADLSSREETDLLATEALGAFGTVDILVNNAGVNAPQAIDVIDDEVWDRVVEINLTAVMRLTRALVPGMKAQGWGRIIHISSVLGVGSKPGRNVYSATKAALIGLAKASALDLGPFGITVNCIGPGPFLTDMPMSLLSEPEKKEFSERTALKRWGTAPRTRRSGPAPRERGGKLHHRRNAPRRWGRLRPGPLKISVSKRDLRNYNN
jgi:NAD(P)-dependent dehydrogenase (short-subunit alcohol dehydrogenase family)